MAQAMVVLDQQDMLAHATPTGMRTQARSLCSGGEDHFNRQKDEVRLCDWKLPKIRSGQGAQ
jgi:hypothetical protein